MSHSIARPPFPPVARALMARCLLAGLAGLTALPVAIWLISLRWHSAKVAPKKLMLLECACILAAWVAVSLNPTLSRLSREAPARYRVLMAALFWLILAGQLTHNSRLTFPFQSFDMYARHNSIVEPACIEMFGVTEDGRRIPISPATLYWAASHSRMSNFVIRLGRPMASLDELPSDSPERALRRERWARLTRAVLDAHNRRGGSRLVAVESDYVIFPAHHSGPIREAEIRKPIDYVPPSASARPRGAGEAGK